MVAVVLAALVSLLAHGVGLSGDALAASWQLLDLEVLEDDLTGSLWHLHTTPPLHNLVVGLALWSPTPVAGTLFVGYGAALLVTGLLLHGLLVRWGLGPLTAGGVAGVSIADPSLLGTIHIASYEVPVSMLVVGSLWAAQRHLDEPRLRWLLATSALLTAGALTRSLLHPVWVVIVLAVLLAARPVTGRHAAAALALPVVLVGGWAAKNDVMFDSLTLSSWSGFNLQRGVVALMDRDDVRDAVDDGTVTRLALEHPWRGLDDYADVAEPCEPERDHPAVSRLDKEAPVTGPIANFNHECYLPLYREASDNALALAGSHPRRYLTTRGPTLVMSYRSSYADDEVSTWMDAAYDPLLLTVDTRIPMDDWNLPLPPGGRDIDLSVTLTLAAATVFVLARGGQAMVRLARAGWPDRHEWPTGEVLWVLVAWTVGLVVVGGDMVEFGENSRFRATVDPLLIALPLASLVRLVSRVRHRFTSDRVAR